MKKFKLGLYLVLFLIGVTIPGAHGQYVGRDAVDAAIIQQRVIDDCCVHNRTIDIFRIQNQIRIGESYINSLKEKRSELDGRLADQMQLEKNLNNKWMLSLDTPIACTYLIMLRRVRDDILSIKHDISSNERKIREAEECIVSLKSQLSDLTRAFDY